MLASVLVDTGVQGLHVSNISFRKVRCCEIMAEMSG